jgi:hypothetical protein
LRKIDWKLLELVVVSWFDRDGEKKCYVLGCEGVYITLREYEAIGC